MPFNPNLNPSFPKKTCTRNSLLPLILILILGFAAYANTLGGQFVWDDEYLVTGNALIRSWAGFPKIFASDLASGSGQKFNFYRPIQTITAMFDYSLWKHNPTGYHLSNIVFHVLAALALYWLITVLFKDPALSLLTSILFVVHPIHTEAVSYISGRADSLAALFMLLAVIFYVRALETKRAVYYPAFIVSFVLALMSRENSLILPVLLLFYHFAFKKKFKPLIFLPLVVLAGIYIALRMTVLDFHLQGNIPASTLAQRIPGFFAALSQYVRLMIVPYPLHMEYGFTIFGLFDAQSLAGLVLVLALGAWLFLQSKKRGLVFFALGWFMITLLPVSNLYPINSYMAEHWLYLPSMGLFLLAAAGLRALGRRKKVERIVLSAVVGLTAFYAILTIAQNRHWRDPIAFYEWTIRYSPDSLRMHNGLALAYYNKGMTAKAIEVYTRAIEKFPKQAFLYNNLGSIYLAKGQKREAEGLFVQAVTLDADYGAAHANLAGIYFRKKEFSLAIEHCDRARELGVVNERLLKALEPYRK